MHGIFGYCAWHGVKDLCPFGGPVLSRSEPSPLPAAPTPPPDAPSPSDGLTEALTARERWARRTGTR